ncbi:MAG: PolC-type DNA polymerase III [Syntrophobacteraceae bacterium]
MIFRLPFGTSQSALISEQRFCAVDLETTGLDPTSDEIIALACIPIEHARILVRDAYYSLIRPAGYRIDAMKIHGISGRDLANAPSFADVADEVLRRTDGIIIGHSIHFDHEVLRRHFRRQGATFRREILDIALVERWLARTCGLVGQDECFDSMLKSYGLRVCYRHNALADAFFAAQIFQLQIARLERQGIRTVAQLKKAVRSCRFAVW